MTLSEIAAIAGYIVTIAGVLAYLSKFRKSISHIAAAVRCLLRSDITEIYYRHSGDNGESLREYERNNLDDLYEGYKSLGGNHYIDDIYKSMRTWRVDP